MVGTPAAASRDTSVAIVASVWLVLPTYEEAGTLAEVVEGALAALARVQADHHVLVVDDASPDGTGALADALARRHRAVRVLHRPGKAGLGPALQAGWGEALAAGAGLVLSMDADGSHDPAALPRLVAAARTADVVIGSRYVPGGELRDWGVLRRCVSRAGCWYARRTLGVRVRDLTSGLRCVRGPVLAELTAQPLAAPGYAFQVELAWRALVRGYTVAEVPIAFSERRAGRSKMTPGIAFEAAWRVPALRLGRTRGPSGPVRRRDGMGHGTPGRSGAASSPAPPGMTRTQKDPIPQTRSRPMPERLTEPPEDQPGVGGAAGGSSDTADTPPGLPGERDDDSAVGDTDQVSDDPA